MAAALTLALAPAALALEPFPCDAPWMPKPFSCHPPPFLEIPIYFHDLAGSAGLTLAQPPGSKTEILFDGRTEPWRTLDGLGFSMNFPPDQYPGWLGKPCVFRVTIPTLGMFEGESFVGAAYLSPESGSQFPVYPVFIIPTTAAELGAELILPLHGFATLDPGQYNERVRFSAFVASSKDTPTYGAEVHRLTSDTTTLHAKAQFPPGCSLAEEAPQLAETPLFEDSTHPELTPVVYWSNYLDLLIQRWRA